MDMTVDEYPEGAALPLKTLPGKQGRTLYREVMELVKITDAGKTHLIRNLSQRVTARGWVWLQAILGKLYVIILDEPTVDWTRKQID